MIGRASARSRRPRSSAATTVLAAVALLASLSACDATGSGKRLPALHVYERFDGGSGNFERIVEAGGVESFAFVTLGHKSLLQVTEPGNALHLPYDLPGDLEVVLRIELPGTGSITPVDGDDYRVRLDATGTSVGLDLSEAGQDALVIRDESGTVLAEKVVTAAEPRSAVMRVVWQPGAGSIRAELYPPDAYSDPGGLVPSMAASAPVAGGTSTTLTITLNATADAPRALDWVAVYEYLP